MKIQNRGLRRVVVTGRGIVHALGNDPETFWNALVCGTSGISKIESEAFRNFPTQIASVVSTVPESAAFEAKESKYWDRSTRFAVYAADRAWSESGLESAQIDRTRVGVWIGSGIGGIETLTNAHKGLLASAGWRTSPYLVPMMISNMNAGIVSMLWNLQGPTIAPVSACATSNNAIGEAFEAIRAGRVDYALAGGAEAPITALAFAGFNSMKAMSTKNEDPERSCTPFALGRTGFVMGEGAGILVLEDLDSALARGANIYGELVGYGSTSDAYHISSPDPEGKGAAAAMNIAIDQAGWNRKDVDYVNAHGTGTVLGDIAETRAIHSVFDRSGHLPLVSSTKSATGHLFGAAGGIEAVACLKTLETQTVAPTIGLETPDPECDLDYVPLNAKKAPLVRVLSNGFGFGGHNAVLAFQKYDVNS